MVKGQNDKIKKHSAKALVVDDSSFMRTVLKDILLENGLSKVYEATDGKEAVEAYRKHRPDIVTMDIIMPGTNGLWAMKTILGIDPKAKIIVVTSIGQENIVEQAMKFGAKGYVKKPFEPPAIAKVVDKLLKT